MLSYDKKLKALSQHLRKNMTDAEKDVVVKIETKAMKGASVLPPKDYREVYR